MNPLRKVIAGLAILTVAPAWAAGAAVALGHGFEGEIRRIDFVVVSNG